GQQVGNRLSLALWPVHTEGVIEATVLADQDDDMLDRAFGRCVTVTIVVLVVVILIVASVVVLMAVMGMVTLVPVAPAQFSAAVARGNNRQRRDDAQRRRGTPSISQIEYRSHR